jgi:iron complex transport system permease protein
MNSPEVVVSDEEIWNSYQKYVGRKAIFIVSSILILILAAGVAGSMGQAKITIWEAYAAFLVKFFPGLFTTSWLAETTVWNLRLPRIALGIVTGIGLGIAGCIMQGILKNPLASPYTLGISAGATFGASLAIIGGAGLVGGEYLIIGNAFIFSLMVSFIIIGFAARRGATPETMVLVGIAILYIFSAGTTLLQYFGEEQAVVQSVFWAVGSLDRASWSKVLISASVIALSIPLLIMKSWDLNLLASGDDSARSLGVNVNRIRIYTMTIISLMVSSIVCFTGTIGFIGLVAPHITRLVIGTDYRYLIPASGIVGAILVVGSDIISRNLIPPIIIPVGVITAFMGGPLFLYLIMKRRMGYF